MKSGALGAESIAARVQQNRGSVGLVVTEIYANFLAARESDPLHRERDFGARAAIEAIRYGIDLADGERAIPMTEDDRALRGGFIIVAEDPERMIAVTTFDFLRGLEAAGRINSVDTVYQMAEAAGRTSSRHSGSAAAHTSVRDAVERLLHPKA